MPANEQHIRDLERVETVAEVGFAKSGAPGALAVRVRGGAASFDMCEFDYYIKEIRTRDSGDIVLNVEPQEQASIGIERTN